MIAKSYTAQHKAAKPLTSWICLVVDLLVIRHFL